MKEITSLNNPKIKSLCTLHNPARSRRTGEILLEGPRLVEEAFQSGQRILEIYITQDFLTANPQWRKVEAPLYLVPQTVMKKASAAVTPQGVLARACRPMVKMEDLLACDELLLLDGIQDPGNVGTLIRTAAAAGVHGVALFSRTADPYQPKTLRATAGAIFRTKVAVVTEEEAFVYSLKKKGFTFYLAIPSGGEDYFGLRYRLPRALLLGGETRGVSPKFYSLPHTGVTIPLERGVESLNVAVAGAVLLFAMARGRLK